MKHALTPMARYPTTQLTLLWDTRAVTSTSSDLHFEET